jgi:hypothetical protein
MTEPAKGPVKLNRYIQIIERIFLDRYQHGMREIPFERDDIARVASALKVKLPKNLGDILYSFRYRTALPDSIRTKAPEGETWIIRPAGRSLYCFALTKQAVIAPNEMMVETKVPNSTPGVIDLYAMDDEQAVLAKLRYNRLIDIFTGVTCYSLQSHYRTSVTGLGQVETDEIYVGVDRRGAHYVFPVQAKGGKDRISVVQIEQDFALCAERFPALVCRPIAAQFMREELIALFDFVKTENGVAVATERHYRLVAPDQLSPEDLRSYRAGPE